jgi:hypothetical protein
MTKVDFEYYQPDNSDGNDIINSIIKYIYLNRNHKIVKKDGNLRLMCFAVNNPQCNKEHIVYKAIKYHNHVAFDTFYNRDTHYNSFLSDAICVSNFHAINKILDNSCTANEDMNYLNIIKNELYYFERSTTAFTKKDEKMIKFLIDKCINEFGDDECEYIYEDFEYEIQNEHSEFIISVKNKTLLDKSIKKCAQICLEITTCRSIENMLWSIKGGPNIYEYLKPVNKY